MRGARIKDFTSTNHSPRDNRKSRLLQRKIIKHSLYVRSLAHYDRNICNSLCVKCILTIFKNYKLKRFQIEMCTSKLSLQMLFDTF